MALPTRRPERRALTASATRYTRPEQQRSVTAERILWQERALSFYDVIGELHYACQFIARQMSRVRYFPAMLDKNGELTEIEEGDPVEILNRIQDPGGGRSRLQYDYGRLMMVTGEGVLFGKDVEEGEPEPWRFLWKKEIKVHEDGRNERIRFDQKSYDPPQFGTGYRLWTPHPRHSDEADSPVRAILDIAEELVILTASVRSTATTRKTHGILAFSQQLSPASVDVGEDEDPEKNPMLSDMIEHMSAQIENPGMPEATIPFIWEVPLSSGERIEDVIRWIKLHDPATDYMERELRTEAIKRMALSMDMPPEALLGMTDANHWTAKQVMHDMWRSHGVVKAEQFADDLAEAYLRPALKDAGYRGWQNVVIGLDDSMVVISPDRTDDADRAIEAGTISDKAYLVLKGFPEEYAATEDEKRIHLAIKLRNPALLKGTPYELSPEELQPAGIPGPTANANGNRDPSEGPPEPTAGRSGSRQEARTASILGGAALALRQCRAKAGARLRTHQHSCEECKKKTDGLPHSIVASTLGHEQVLSFGADPLALVKGGTDEFRGLLCEQGIEASQADVLCQRIEVYAAKTLFDLEQPELPPGFTAQVTQIEEVSDALVYTA